MDELWIGPADRPDLIRLGPPVDAGSEGVIYRGFIDLAAGSLPVAVKMLQPRHADRVGVWAQQWRGQVDLLRQVDLPGLVGVRDVFLGAMPHRRGVTGGPASILYLTMDWVEGTPLPQWRRTTAPSEPQERLRVLLPVAAALDVIHSGTLTEGQAVLHRDVKPANILVRAGGEAVLVDVGLLRGPAASDEEGLAGTPGYLAPEVRSEGRFSPASDRYALGAVAWFLLTGEEPALEATTADLAGRLAQVPALAGRRDLVDHVMTMLDADPARRPSSLANWVAQLEGASLVVPPARERPFPRARRRNPQPPPSAPPGRWRERVRMPDRTTVAVGAVTALLVAVLAVVVTIRPSPAAPALARPLLFLADPTAQGEVGPGGEPGGRFVALGTGPDIFLTSSGVLYRLTEDPTDESGAWVVRHELVLGSRVAPEGTRRGPTRVVWHKGPTDEQGADVETYTEVTYRQAWPGIDMAYTGMADTGRGRCSESGSTTSVVNRNAAASAQRLGYRFTVAPGTDLNLIRMAWWGAEGLEVSNVDDGLTVKTPRGSIAQSPPRAYQHVEECQPVGVRFTPPTAGMAEGAQEYGIKVSGAYDRERPLVIEVLGPEVAGLLGARQAGVAAGPEGSSFVAGSLGATQATFPDRVGDQRSYVRKEDAYVAKLSADGKAVDWLYVIGGQGDSGAKALVVDDEGAAYFTGDACGPGLPLPLGTTFGGKPNSSVDGCDAFVAKIDNDGRGLAMLGYLGGEGYEVGEGLAVGADGAVHLVGATTSREASFPARTGPGLNFNGGDLDAFVAKISTDGSLAWAGFLGGDASDWGTGIDVDDQGAAYITGTTQSTERSFSVKGGPDTSFNGGQDAFVAKVDAQGALAWAGYVGGAGQDSVLAIAVDANGAAYLTGWTSSNEETFPVRAEGDLTIGGGNDGFVVKVTPDGSRIAWATYLGGDESDGGQDVVIAADDTVLVAGDTWSDQRSFPVRRGPTAIDRAHGGGGTDGFLAKLAPDGRALSWAGYVGGAGDDEATGLALDRTGRIHVSGDSSSPGSVFPLVVAAYRSPSKDAGDATSGSR